jgi:hypothetical protein
MTQRFTPALFIALFNTISFAVLIGFHLATQTPIHFVNKWIMPGVDYQDFYQASTHLLNGESPYLVTRYVTPPLFAFVNLPLSLLGFDLAHLFFVFIIFFTVLYSFLIIQRALGNSNAQDDWLALSGIFVILFSYPFYFLFERGNIDGVVLFCMCLSLYFMDTRPALSGLLLAAAIHFKLYPILLLLPIFIFRRWKPFLWTLTWLLVFVMLTASYWNEFLLLLPKRSNSFQLFENGSLVNTLLFSGILLTSYGKGEAIWSYAPLYAAVLFALLMGMMILTDFKLSRTNLPKQNMLNALLYFPFMVALPKSVYHYEFVVLIPLLPVLDHLWKETATERSRFLLWMIALGVALSQWQAVALFDLTNNLLAYYIPGFGLLIVMIGISTYKWLQLRESLKQVVPAPLTRKGPSFFPDAES